jgi:hypothetical protein
MRYLWLVLIVLAAIPLAGCDAIEGIFKAGVWVGVLAVVLVIGLIGFIVAKMGA